MTKAEGGITRRDVITRVAGAGVGIASMLKMDARVAAQAGAPAATPRPGDPKFPKPPSWKTELRQLGPGVYAYVQAGGPGQGNGGGISNAGIIDGGDRLMVIDTLSAPLHIKGLITATRAAAGNKPFKHVINTHHHGDHVGNNQYFPEAEIIGHEFCRQEVIKLNWQPKWEKREGWAEGGEVRTKMPPTTTVDDNATMRYHYGNTVVELIHMGIAHTWGDLLVYLPQHKAIFLGDVGFHYIVPFSHAGQVTNWLKVIDRILGMDVETIVPGHGPIGGKKELAEMAEYYKVLKGEARKKFDAGVSPGRAAADIKMGKFDNWIGTERIVLNTFRLYCEFDGTLTPVLDIPRMTKAVDEFNAIMKTQGVTPAPLDGLD
jgi:cyclase